MNTCMSISNETLPHEAFTQTVQEVSIQRLGCPEVTSPLAQMLASGERQRQTLCYVDEDLLGDGQIPRPMAFELAGPRRIIYFEPQKTRCAIVTCGGLCPGINDVIRSVVMTAYNDYHVAAVFGVRYGLQGLVSSDPEAFVELTPKSVEQIHDFGGTVLGTSRGPQSSARVLDALAKRDISILFIIGGDGTMKAAAAIQTEANRLGRQVAIVGVPKTIDNDINFVPYSFGFETAVSKAAEAIRCVHVEAASVRNGVGIVKLMGRDSGFITAHAALSVRHVDFVLVPEVPFVLHGEYGLLSAIERCLLKKEHAVLAVAEGAGQELLPASETCDASGNRMLGDIGGFLANAIKMYFTEKKQPCYMKYIDPSYLIRSIPANSADKLYSGFLGQHAVHAAMSGKTGMVVANIMDKFVHLPFELVTQKRRTMRQNSDLWQAVLETTGQAKHRLHMMGR